jgi:D-alanyl-D-alanine carboxypeptidase
LRGFFRVVFGLVSVLAITAVILHPAEAGHPSEAGHLPRSRDSSPPYSAIVVDANSGNVLHAASADEIRHPASLTKIMTLYLLFERMEAGNLKLNSKLPVSEHASGQAPSKLGLEPGQTIAVEDAIRALVTKSANDVAVVVAEAIGGNEAEFADMMTKKADALGMNRTIYRNASGLPDEAQVTTARDQALLGRAIQERFPRQYRYFSTPSFTYRGEEMRNHNHLLGQVEGIDGIKTGYTSASGFNLVTSVHRNNRHLVAVVLGGTSAGARDARMRNLIEIYIASASASTQRTVPAVAQAAGARTEKIATKAKDIGPPKTAATYSVASFSAPSAWPASQLVPATSSDGLPALTVAPFATRITAAAPINEAIKPPPVTKSAADDVIRPILVKTVNAKLTQTAGIGPMTSVQEERVDAAEPAHVAVLAVAATATAGPPSTVSPAPVTEPAALAKTPTPKAVGAPPVPVAKTAPTIEPVPAPVRPPRAAAVAREPKHEVAPRNPATTHVGWIVQVGAFDVERDAKERLSSALAKIGHALNSADPFTEPVVKGDKTLYRARFGGFPQKEKANAFCDQLKLSDIDCLTIKN